MRSTGVYMVLLLYISLLAAGCNYNRISTWDLKCGACHDGTTVLNGNVVMGKDEMQSKYKNLEDFVNSCDKTPACMSILKHDRKLFRTVGIEIGIGKGAAR